MTVSATGHYFGIQRFLRLLRASADLHNGHLVGNGRVYTVDSIQFTGVPTGGLVTATMAVNGFTYSDALRPLPRRRRRRRLPTRAQRPSATDVQRQCLSASQDGLCQRRGCEAAQAEDHRDRRQCGPGRDPRVRGAAHAQTAQRLESRHRCVRRCPVRRDGADDVAGCRRELRALRRHSPADPFSAGQVAGGVPAYGAAATPRGLHDPFVSTGSAGSTSVPTTTTPPPTTQILPKQIVIGTPGGGRVASHGWILILASVPTGQGRSKATQVAKQARNHGLTFVSILNSSNSRPLRGGYWVVYTGPYPGLGAVNTAAEHVHASGFAGCLHPRADRLHRTREEITHGRVRVRRNQRAGRRDHGHDQRARCRSARASSCRRAGSCRQLLREKAAAGEQGVASAFKKVKPKSLQIFSRQLATMIEAGVSVVAALVDARGADRRQVSAAR